MMSIFEALDILDGIEATPEQIKKSAKYMSDKMEKSLKTKMYQKQGGVMLEFSDKSVAWLTMWNMDGKIYLHLTERGECIYMGTDNNDCAKMLYKLGIAHKTVKNFLGCA